MARLNLFEFNDAPWFPRLLRRYEVDYLETLFRLTGAYEPAVRVLASMLEEINNAGTKTRIVDLGSGGGGPLPSILPQLREKAGTLDVVLTDLHPQPESWQDLISRDHGISYNAAPVDAADPMATLREPSDTPTLYTMFEVFHHFRRPLAKKILVSAVADQRPLAIFDAVSRTPRFILGSIFIPLAVLLMTPRIRPFRWTRLLFTYLIPILPIVIGWDGLVSHLRAWKQEELADLASELAAPGWTWTANVLKEGQLEITTLFGRPDKAAPRAP